MAKKTFKSGLDSLLSATGMEKDDQRTETENIKPAELSPEEKHWLHLKIERIQKELKHWRTGSLTPETFAESLKQQGLTYNSETNEIEESKD